MTEAELQTWQRIELGYVRQSMVEAVVRRKIDSRNGDVTGSEVEQWEREAYQQWREQHPALSQMFPSHLGTAVGDGGHHA